MNKLAPAIVLSHGPGGLGTVRALARRDVPVAVIAWDSTDLVLNSRYPDDKRLLQGNSDQQKKLHLLELLRELPYEGAAILTTSDLLVAFISAHQEELLRKYRFRLPPEDLLSALNDKRRETELVGSLGFPVPKTLTTLPDEPGRLAQELRFPIIFKPCDFSVQHIFPLKNLVVRDRSGLDAFYRQWRPALPVLLAQEVIPGPDSASWICSTTFDARHRMLDCGIKQKLRALPAHFGGSTYAVSRDNDEIRQLARALGSRLKYVGHAGIEFRWDRRDGQYKYIELNPRMPANVGFDEACGLQTVWNSYRVALTGEGSFPPASQEKGIVYLDLKGDFRSGRSDGAGRLTVLLRLLVLLLGKRTSGPWFAWDDPVPGIVVAWRFFAGAFRAAAGKPRPATAVAKRKA